MAAYLSGNTNTAEARPEDEMMEMETRRLLRTKQRGGEERPLVHPISPGVLTEDQRIDSSEVAVARLHTHREQQRKD